MLFTASIFKHILRFHLPYMEWFKGRGVETHVTSYGDEDLPYCNKHWNVLFESSLFQPGI